MTDVRLFISDGPMAVALTPVLPPLLDREYLLRSLSETCKGFSVAPLLLLLLLLLLREASTSSSTEEEMSLFLDKERDRELDRDEPEDDRKESLGPNASSLDVTSGIYISVFS